MTMDPTGSLIAEADQLVDRANFRIEQYRRHIENMERGCLESEGAALVLSRLENVVIRLRLYRDVLSNEPANGADKEHERIFPFPSTIKRRQVRL
jgi:hypothetical protein